MMRPPPIAVFGRRLADASRHPSTPMMPMMMVVMPTVMMMATMDDDFNLGRGLISNRFGGLSQHGAGRGCLCRCRKADRPGDEQGRHKETHLHQDLAICCFNRSQQQQARRSREFAQATFSNIRHFKQPISRPVRTGGHRLDAIEPRATGGEGRGQKRIRKGQSVEHCPKRCSRRTVELGSSPHTIRAAAFNYQRRQ